DAPELAQPEGGAIKHLVETLVQRARARGARFVLAHEEPRRDKYGRAIADVWIVMQRERFPASRDGGALFETPLLYVSLAETLLRMGLAYVFRDPVDKSYRDYSAPPERGHEAFESEARNAWRGVWHPL